MLDSDDLMLVDGEGREVELVDAETGEGEVREGGREDGMEGWGSSYAITSLQCILTPPLSLPPSLPPSLHNRSKSTSFTRPT